MSVNDYAGCLDNRVAFKFIASGLAPTHDMALTHRVIQNNPHKNRQPCPMVV